jgi:D-lactate dehydrogenase
MKDINIAFFDAKPYDIESFNATNKNYNYNIKYLKNKLNADTAFQTKGYNVVCVFVNDSINEEVIKILVENKIELIVLRCAGYNNVDLRNIYKKIHVARVPAYSPYAIAEHAVALMLSLNRKTHRAYMRTRDNNFNITGLLGFDMFGKTAGIIGTGKIGKILIKILKGFGMNVLAYDLMPDYEDAKSIGFEYVDVERIYKESDIISLHCPLTKNTLHLINDKTISKMKDNVMIINTGRGQLIDTKALIDGLKNGKIGYAGLDVYEEESEYFFEDFSNSIIGDDTLARLLTFPNVIITSHQAFFTKEALSNISFTTFNNIKEYFEEDRLTNEICYKCSTPECIKKLKGKCF